jgi:charged multivesicular body protein 4
MGSVAIGPQFDDTELEDELEQLQQQELEDKMLETGSVPVDRLPTVASGESELTQGWEPNFSVLTAF